MVNARSTMYSPPCSVHRIPTPGEEIRSKSPATDPPTSFRKFFGSLAAGARMAAPGEFTLRAYFAGKLDLSQAEAVADLIASSSRAAHALATNQMRGGYSAALDTLRDRLLHLASLLELELDFSEEDVEFADRGELRQTMEHIDLEIERLRNSFALGNALKEGIPVTIVGAPNAGKSTLLNRLLDEERAIVSEIAGTTRDVIEETVNIEGIRCSGSSTRPASVRPTTGWSAWASNVRCSALPKPVSLSAYSTSRHSPPRHLCVPSIRSRLPISRYRKAPHCSRSQTKSTFIQSLFYRKGLSVCPLKTDKGLIHSVAPWLRKQSEAMRSNGDITGGGGGERGGYQPIKTSAPAGPPPGAGPAPPPPPTERGRRRAIIPDKSEVRGGRGNPTNLIIRISFKNFPWENNGLETAITNYNHLE